MRLTVRDIRDVAERQLCCGCGVCAYLAPDEIERVVTLDDGRRPVFKNGAVNGVRLTEALNACPGIELSHDHDSHPEHTLKELADGWGPVLELYEGHAVDDELRYAGSSGGVASALALYCIEQDGMHGVLHIAARTDVPYLNHTVLSTTRAEILAATGSRYAPASPCDGLQQIAEASAPCVLIGKPCDVAASRKARRNRSELDQRLGLTIAVFCAGTPTTAGTHALCKAFGIDDPATVRSLRYRGNGWPGQATATFQANGRLETRRLTYAQSWGEVLTSYQQWRCNLCADHTGEFADIAVGDHWQEDIPPNEPGRSLVLVRTPHGRRILQDALQARYLNLTRVMPEVLPAAQPNLLLARAAVWGRIMTLKLLGLPTPRYKGLPMFQFWWSRLSLAEKARSLVGTARRIFKRKLLRRQQVVVFNPMV